MTQPLHTKRLVSCAVQHGKILLGLTFILASAACTSTSDSPVSAGMGQTPALPAPQSSLIPTVKIAPAQGWADGVKPNPAAGLSVSAYATGLDHPRSMLVLPNGDILVAETNAPAKHDEKGGIKGWVMKRVMKMAGAGVPSANRITLLRGLNSDGTAVSRTVFLKGLHSPFGMALIGNDFYVANTDAIVRFPYHTGDTQITAEGVKVMDLPAGQLNHHWTKDLIAGPQGKHLYVSVGSNSNVAENGMEVEHGRAAVHKLDLSTGESQLFASGLRNPNGFAWEPQTGALWVAVNERDDLGNDLVPDYMTSLQEGGFYGWPYSYYGDHLDMRVKPQRPDLVAKAIVPDYALGAHTASLGLAFYTDNLLPQKYRGGVFVSQHGSWNRKPPSGYRVIYVPFANGQPAGNAEEILTGFLDAKGNANGRPVSVAIDNQGALLVSDDVGNAIWRVSPATPKNMAVNQ